MLTVNDLFNKVGLTPSSPIKWGYPVPESANGVYVISLSDNPNLNNGTFPICEIKQEIFDNWKKLSPELNVGGLSTRESIEKELNTFWKSNENILYIGESSSETNGIRKRVKQFYDHQVGWKGPHTGGYWLKLLSQLESLCVYYAVCANPRDTEFKMLLYFIEQAAGKNFYELEILGRHLPFANLKVDFNKAHSIKRAVPQKRSIKSE